MRISNKLKSKSGSSLFLTLIFAMFCFFVGGTVLAAATANAGRLTALKRDRSAYYMERNAAVLIQNQLLGDRKTKPSVTLNQVTSMSGIAVNPQRSDDIHWNPSSATMAIHVTTSEKADPDPDKAIEYTNLQKYMCESIVKAYLGENGGAMRDYNEDASVSHANLADTSGTILVSAEGIEMAVSYSMEKPDPTDPDKWVAMETIDNEDHEKESFNFRILFRVKNQSGDDGQFQIVVPVQVYRNVSYGYRDANYNSTQKIYTLVRDDTISYTVNLDYAVIEKSKAEQPVGGGT